MSGIIATFFIVTIVILLGIIFGSIALDLTARSHAWLDQRDYVSPEDIHAMAADTLRHRIPRLSAADLIALGVPWGLMLGRVANFINAELWGRPTTVPWGVAFPGAAAQDCPEVIGLCARHPSQLYEAALEGLVLGILLLWLAYRRGAFHRPGLVSGTFFAGYGAARFFVEFFRQPDAQFVTPENPMGYALHFGGLGVTMGQLLSLPMLALGLILIALSRRSRAA